MVRVIINADDCGKSEDVDAQIERFINEGKITSTSVMANMQDLDGAKRLYEKYRDRISFGIHLNLTEGTPLIECKELEDYGFYIRRNGVLLFNGKQYYHKLLPPRLWPFIQRELEAQIDRIIKLGIVPSHIDSHNHIHTSPCLFFLIPSVIKKYGYQKVRKMRNVRVGKLSNFIRTLWAYYIRVSSGNPKMTDKFCSFSTFLSGVKLNDNQTLEIMCHPGGIYPDEDARILESDFIKIFHNCELINYNQL